MRDGSSLVRGAVWLLIGGALACSPIKGEGAAPARDAGPPEEADSSPPAGAVVPVADASVPDAPAPFMARGWIWENPNPQGNALMSVWAVGPRDVWAVGRSGTVAHWDGVSWDLDTPGSEAIDTNLQAVWASGPDDVWTSGRLADGRPGIFHWDGRRWSRRGTASGGEVIAVTGSGPKDVWFAGHQQSPGNQPILDRWDGASFAPVPLGALDPTATNGGTLGGAWSGGAGELWLTMNEPRCAPAILHFDGTWSRSAVPTASRLTGIWADRAGEVWAVGRNLSGSQDDSLVVRREGAEWRSLPTGAGSRLQSVWGDGAGRMFVRGASSIARWDGAGWTPVPMPGAFSPAALEGVLALHGSSASDLWVVGGTGLAARWDGAAWQEHWRGTRGWWRDIGGTTSEVRWVVGDQGGIARRTPSGWEPVPSGTDQTLQAVWAVDDSEAWAVGDNGTIVHWQGGAWARVPSGTGVTLFDVWASGPSDAWAVGDAPSRGERGEVLHWDGRAWTRVAIDVPTSSGWRAVSGTGPSDVWVVGSRSIEGTLESQSLALHWDGRAWRPTDVPASWLLAVWAAGPDDVWAGGTALLRWDGTRWTAVAPAPVPGVVDSLWGRAPNDVWAVSHGLMHWDGARWQAVTTPTPPTSVWGNAGGDVWISTYAGSVLRRSR